MAEQERRYRRHGGLVWPLVLMTAGVIFLLNNLGLLSWNVWDVLWRFWPVLLIAIGLDILLGRRSVFGAIVAFVLIVVILGGTVWYAVTQAPIFTGQALVTDKIVQELAGATSADVRISFGAGSLRIGALKESGSLIEGTVVTGPGETVLRDFHVDDGVARFSLRHQGVPRVIFGRPTSQVTWDLDLSSSVPMALRVNSGVGEVVLDLSDLQVTDLDVNGGVGQVQLRLPSQGRLRGKISGGIGQVIVTIPQGVAARVRASGGLGGVSVAGRFQRDGRYYVVGNYETADNRIDLDISGGIGEVVIR